MTLQTAQISAELWKKQLAKIFQSMTKYAAAAVSFQDPEDLHKARVNNRKLLTLLKVMEPSEQLDDLLSSLRKSQKLFGRIRDRDVLIDAFKQRRKAIIDKGQRKLMKSFIRFQKAERKHHRKQLQKKLPKLIGRRLNKQWAAFIDATTGNQIGEEQVRNYLHQLEAKFDHRLVHYEQWKQEQGMTHPDTLEALHKVRLQVKELRYLLKHTDFVHTVDAENKQQYYEQLQEPLGTINDRRVWLERWNEVGPHQLGADPVEFRRLVNQLSEELAQEIGKLQMVRPVIN
jgi:CHAD domain-containing protein